MTIITINKITYSLHRMRISRKRFNKRIPLVDNRLYNKTDYYQPFFIYPFIYFTIYIKLKGYFHDIKYLMTLPLDTKNRLKSKKRLLPNWSQFAEAWAGVGIWAITFELLQVEYYHYNK